MVQLLINGLAMGCIYALVALGFLLIFQAVGAINFAQGDILMLGAFLGVWFSADFKLPLLLAFAVTILAMAVFGLLFHFVAYYPLRDKPFLTVIISTIGVGIALRNAAQLKWGALPLSLPSLVGSAPINVAGNVILPQHIFIIAVTIVLLVGQYLFFTRTMLGRMMQATAQDPDAARLMGIPVTQMVIWTFAISCIMAGIGGLLLAPVFFVTTDMGGMVALKAFVASIVGGFGSLPGAVAGAILLGILEIFGAAYIDSKWKDAIAFLVLILVLWFAPRGIFGEKVSEKV